MFVHPTELPKISGAVRTAAVESPVSVKARLETLLKAPPPVLGSRTEALALQPRPGPQSLHAERGWLAADATTARRSGWTLSESAINPEYGALPPSSRLESLLIERADDLTYRISMPGSSTSFEARSYDAAVDLVAQAASVRRVGTPWTMYFTNVESAEASNFLRSVEVRSAAHRGQLQGLGRARRGATLADMRRTLNGDYNFRAAKLKSSSIEVVGGREVLTATFEVPAVVVARPGASVDERELSEFCRQRLASFKKPEVFHFLDALPKNQMGKVLKKDLRAQLGAA